MHSSVVWYIALGYFATQVAFFVFANLGIRSQFANWKREIESGAKLTRADALQQLERLLTCVFWRASLKKLGYCATLLGVLLTGMGFLLFQSPESGTGFAGGDRIEFSEVLRQFQPLYLGVVAGATLALINQFLVHFVDWHAARIRIAAEGAFSDATITPIKKEIEYLGGVIHSIATEVQLLMQTQVANSKKSLALIQQTMEASCKEMSQLTRDYKNSVQNVKGESDQLQAELKIARKMANQSVTKLNETLSKVGQELGVASSQMKAAGNGLAFNLDSAGKATQKLEQASREVERAAAAAAESSRSASELLGHANGTTVPARKAAEQANLAIERVVKGAKSLESSSDKLNAGTNMYAETIRQVAENIGQVSQASKSFVAEVARIEPSVAEFEQLLSQLKSMAGDPPDELGAALQSRIVSSEPKGKSPNGRTGIAGLFKSGTNREEGES